MSHAGRSSATRGEPAASRPGRRSVLRGAAGLGAAGLAAGFLAGEAAAPGAGAAPREDTAPQAAALAAHEPVVAHVHDARNGTVDLFAGTRHVRVSDRELAARLARAARSVRSV